MTHRAGRRRVHGPIRARPTAVGRETWPEGSSGGGAPPWTVHVAGGGGGGVAGDASHGPKPNGSQMGQNDPIRCSQYWGVFF